MRSKIMQWTKISKLKKSQRLKKETKERRPTNKRKIRGNEEEIETLIEHNGLSKYSNVNDTIK
jgi:hypothetical protein